MKLSFRISQAPVTFFTPTEAIISDIAVATAASIDAVIIPTQAVSGMAFLANVFYSHFRFY